MSRSPREPLRPMPRRGDGPRRVPGGQRLLRDADHGPWPWPAEGWLQLLSAKNGEEAATGLAYARSGQIATLEIGPGLVSAKVQGHAGRPYATTIRWAPLSPEVIDRFVSRVASDGAVAGAVLLDELPPRIEPLLADAGADLRPGEAAAIEVHCTCVRGAGCRHQVALGWLLQERCIENPWRLLELRGISRADLQDRIRLERRVAAGDSEGGPSEAGAEWTAPLGSFWRPGPSIGELDAMPPAHHAPLAILRRLGQSPLEGRFPLMGLLDSAFEAIANTGRRLSTIGDADQSGEREGEAADDLALPATESEPSDPGEGPVIDAVAITSMAPEPTAPPKARKAVAKRIDRRRGGGL